jgi:hypothetical protein
MNKTIYAGLVAGVIVAGMIMSTTLSVTDVFAGKNEWGKLASDLAKAGKMGEHASDPDHDGDKGQDPDHSPRQGVGNLDLDGDGERDHPSETADTLRGICDSIPDEDPRCP